MGMHFDDEQLLNYLLKSVTGESYDCEEIGLADLYGKDKPSEIFGTTITDHYVLTELEKKKYGGKNFSRAIGNGCWKARGGGTPVYDKERSKIGIKREFRFEEANHVWNMKEYRLTDSKLDDLRRRGEIKSHGELVICHIRRNASSSSQCQGAVKSFAQENQDLGQSSVIPSDMTAAKEEEEEEEECSVPVIHQQTPSVKEVECSVPVVHQENPSVSFIAKEEECSVPVIHQETPSVSFIAKDEECSVPVIHQETPSVSFIAKDEECSVPVIHQETPSVSFIAKDEECSVPVIHQETPSVSFIAKDEECSVPVIHQETPSVKEEECSVPVVHQQTPSVSLLPKDEDEIPLFVEDS